MLCPLGAYERGSVWVLVRTSAKAAAVRRAGLAELPELLSSGQGQLLQLWRTDQMDTS